MYVVVFSLYHSDISVLLQVYAQLTKAKCMSIYILTLKALVTTIDA